LFGEIVLQYLWAFIIGGAICVLGQILMDKFKLTPAKILVSFVVAGVVLFAFNLYQPLRDFAGAGASVPILGFGAAIAQGTERAVAENGALGILTGGLIGSAAGIAAAMIASYILSLFTKSKDK